MKQVITIAAMLVIIGAGCTNEVSNESEGTETNETDNVNVTNEQQEAMIYESPGVLDAELIDNKQIRIKTEKGDIVFELYSDTAPLTVSNFVYLANAGYYNGLIFHRREEGFVIQGGDPNGNGTGGPGYTFSDELDDDYEYTRGIVAMANRGPDTNGSQFFIMLDDVDLPKLYTIFGRVTEGMDIVDSIEIGDVMASVTVEALETENVEQ